MISQSENKKCLVIGANGFVGSHLVNTLVGANWEVVAFDRFSRNPQFALSSKVQIVKGDFFSEDDLRGVIPEVDYVIHAFSATTPFISDSDPYIDIEKNLTPTLKILDLCVENNIQKFVFISSGGAVYGKAAERGAVSEIDAAEPTSPYGIIKLTIEHYLTYFEKKHKLSHVSYRLTNPYGPGQVTKNNQGVIAEFTRRILNDEKITVLGDGTSARDYVYIEDACRMIVDTFSQETRYGTYNVGSGSAMTLQELISLISELTDKTPQIEYALEPKTFLHTATVNMERFIDEFGEPSLVNPREGLQKYIEWLKQ